MLREESCSCAEREEAASRSKNAVGKRNYDLSEGKKRGIGEAGERGKGLLYHSFTFWGKKESRQRVWSMVSDRRKRAGLAHPVMVEEAPGWGGKGCFPTSGGKKSGAVGVGCKRRERGKVHDAKRPGENRGPLRVRGKRGPLTVPGEGRKKGGPAGAICLVKRN